MATRQGAGLDVAVRTAGGVAMALLRLEQVCGRKSG
jgi:hypothetical protein